MQDEHLIIQTTDRTFAARMMNDHHWVSDQGSHYVITSVLHMADPFGESMWPIYGHLEGAHETCPTADALDGLGAGLLEPCGRPPLPEPAPEAF